MPFLIDQLDAVRSAMPLRVVGRIQGISGLTIEASDLSLPIGSLCRIDSFGGKSSLAEVIGFHDELTLLMPLSSMAGVSRFDRIENISSAPRIWCSEQLLGRVINGLGEPIDDLLRSSGHYGPKVDVPDDADTQTKLIAFTGRDPAR